MRAFEFILLCTLNCVNLGCAEGMQPNRNNNGLCSTLDDLELTEYLRDDGGWDAVVGTAKYFCGEEAPAYLRCICSDDFAQCSVFRDPSGRNVGTCKVGWFGYSFTPLIVIVVLLFVITILYICFLRGHPRWDGRRTPIFPLHPAFESWYIRSIQTLPDHVFSQSRDHFRDESHEEYRMRMRDGANQESRVPLGREEERRSTEGATPVRTTRPLLREMQTLTDPFQLDEVQRL